MLRMIKMRKLISISLLLLLASAFTMLALPVHAEQQNPWVYTCKEDGTPSDQFAAGEKVMIIAYSANPCPYDIIVYDPDRIIRFTDQSTEPNYKNTVSGITDKPGWWEVKAGTSSTHYASAWYHDVIPEVPFGTMAILLSMFGALGFFAMKKKRNFFIGMPS